MSAPREWHVFAGTVLGALAAGTVCWVGFLYLIAELMGGGFKGMGP